MTVTEDVAAPDQVDIRLSDWDRMLRLLDIGRAKLESPLRGDMGSLVFNVTPSLTARVAGSDVARRGESTVDVELHSIVVHPRDGISVRVTLDNQRTLPIAKIRSVQQVL